MAQMVVNKEEQFKKAIKSEYYNDRLNAIQALNKTDVSWALPYIITTMNDKQSEVRENATQYFLKSVNKSNFSKFLDVLKDKKVEKTLNDALTTYPELKREVIMGRVRFVLFRGTSTANKEGINDIERTLQFPVLKKLIAEEFGTTPESLIETVKKIKDKGKDYLRELYPKFTFAGGWNMENVMVLKRSLETLPGNYLKILGGLTIKFSDDSESKKLAGEEGVSAAKTDLNSIEFTYWANSEIITHEFVHLYHAKLIGDLGKSSLGNFKGYLEFTEGTRYLTGISKQPFNVQWATSNEHGWGVTTILSLWKGGKDREEPAGGFVDAYGASDYREDVATFAAAVMHRPEEMKKLCKESKVANKKIALLFTYGFISKEQYDAVVK